MRARDHAEGQTIDSHDSYIGLARTITLREGVTALIAVGAVVFLCVGVWSKLTAIDDKINSANKSMAAFVSMHTQIESERARLAVTQINIERLVCISVAKDDATRRECGREASPMNLDTR
jgi:hypothetical protein